LLINQDVQSLSIYNWIEIGYDFALTNSVERGIPLSVERIYGVKTAQFPAATWRDYRSMCCLADGERHLGNVVRDGNHWLAFDGTHLDDTRAGFRLLGSCTDITAAKRAVEQAVAGRAAPKRKIQRGKQPCETAKLFATRPR
jgi:hypothetical protein